MLRGFQWSSLPPSSITATVSNSLKHFVRNFLISVNDELIQVAHILRSPFLSWLVWGCKYQNTQHETVEAKQKSKSPGIRQYSESFIGDPAPFSVMSKVPSALVLRDFHLGLEVKCLKDFLHSPVHTKLSGRWWKLDCLFLPFGCVCMCLCFCVCARSQAQSLMNAKQLLYHQATFRHHFLKVINLYFMFVFIHVCVHAIHMKVSVKAWRGC